MTWTTGSRFRHAKWLDARLEPELCEVVSVKGDFYKGRPIVVVRGNPRRE